MQWVFGRVEDVKSPAASEFTPETCSTWHLNEPAAVLCKVQDLDLNYVHEYTAGTPLMLAWLLCQETRGASSTPLLVAKKASVSIFQQNTPGR